MTISQTNGTHTGQCNGNLQATGSVGKEVIYLGNKLNVLHLNFSVFGAQQELVNSAICRHSLIALRRANFYHINIYILIQS